MPSATSDRIPRNTPRSAQRRIEQRLARRLSYYAMRPADIGHRLAELDREWPIDRTLQANAAAVVLAGLGLGLALDRRALLLLPAAVGAFLLQHALQGWCPPLPLFRWMGVRSAEEIAAERYALKALRGDFRDVAPAGAWQPALEQATVEPGTPAAIALRDRAAGAMAAVRR
jgi:hypothetical protein